MKKKTDKWGSICLQRVDSNGARKACDGAEQKRRAGCHSKKSGTCDAKKQEREDDWKNACASMNHDHSLVLDKKQRKQCLKTKTQLRPTANGVQPTLRSWARVWICSRTSSTKLCLSAVRSGATCSQFSSRRESWLN